MAQGSPIAETARVALRLQQLGLVVPDNIWLQGPLLRELRALYFRGLDRTVWMALQQYPARTCALGGLVLAHLCSLNLSVRDLGEDLIVPTPKMVRHLTHFPDTLLAEVEASFEQRPPSEILGEMPRASFLFVTGLWPNATTHEERYMQIMSNLALNSELTGTVSKLHTQRIYVSCWWQKHGILCVQATQVRQDGTPLTPGIWYCKLAPRLNILQEGVDAFLTVEEARNNVLERIVKATHEGAAKEDSFRNYRNNLPHMLVHEIPEGASWDSLVNKTHPFTNPEHSKIHRVRPFNPKWYPGREP